MYMTLHEPTKVTEGIVSYPVPRPDERWCVMAELRRLQLRPTCRIATRYDPPADQLTSASLVVSEWKELTIQTAEYRNHNLL